jgi:hypothetical protein
MRRLSAVAALSLLLAVPAFGQAPTTGAPDGQRPRFQTPPDHWMTIDSPRQALTFTADQRAKISPPYDFNAVMKVAAARRQAIRQQMQEFQTEADKWIASIRAGLTTDQQAKFDSMPKPQLVRRPGSMGGGPTRP